MIFTLIITVANFVFNFVFSIISNIFLEISSLVLSPAVIATYIQNLNSINQVFPVYTVFYFVTLGIAIELGFYSFIAVRTVIKFIFKV